MIINLEAQNDFYLGHPLTKRGIYECCRMFSAQYGREFTGSHYEKLKKVYSIWICINPPKSRRNIITRHWLTEEHFAGEAVELVQNYDLLSIIMLYLGGPVGEHYDGVLRMLDVLLSSETSKAEKRKDLQNEYDIQMTRATERDVAVMSNLSRIYGKELEKGHGQRHREGHPGIHQKLHGNNWLDAWPSHDRVESAGGQSTGLSGPSEKTLINQGELLFM